MLPRTVTILGFACAAQLLVVGEASAQRWPIGLEGTWGFGSGFGGGEYVDEPAVQIAIDLTGVVAVRSLPNGGIALALSAGLQALGPHTLVCRINPEKPNECIPHFPSFLIFSATGGWENRRKTLRLSGGPAFMRDLDFEYMLGLQLRVDGARSLGSHFSLAGSIRAHLVPDYNGSVVQMFAVGVGLRLR